MAVVTSGRGDRKAQRRRYRARYRGCRICGVKVKCTECTAATSLVEMHGPGELVLVVDGSFVSPTDERGHRGRGEPGYGGAGLVLVLGGVTGDVIASRACGFVTFSSHDAEYQAVGAMHDGLLAALGRM